MATPQSAALPNPGPARYLIKQQSNITWAENPPAACVPPPPYRPVGFGVGLLPSPLSPQCVNSLNLNS